MYYLVSGTGDGSFEWVIEADSEEFARQNAMKDLSADDKITSIKALSVDECIELGYIRVMKDNSIIIVLKGGIQIREPIETNN